MDDAREQELGVGNLHARTFALFVPAIRNRTLVETRHVHFGDAVFLADAPPGRLETWMGMNVDKARHDHHVLSVDDVVRFPAVATADMNDRIALERNVGISQIAVRLGGLVPRDDPIGILNQRNDTHGWAFKR